MKTVKRLISFFIASLLAVILWAYSPFCKSQERKEEIKGILIQYKEKAATMKKPIIGLVKITLILWLAYYSILWAIVGFSPTAGNIGNDGPLAFYLGLMAFIALVPIPENWLSPRQEETKKSFVARLADSILGLLLVLCGLFIIWIFWVCYFQYYFSPMDFTGHIR